MDESNYKKVRKGVIEIVLATDMSKHFEDMNKWKSRLNSNDFDPTSEADKVLCYKEMVHIADISNASKTWFVCYKWIELLFLEFYHQGDKEKELGHQVSFLMDRETTNMAKAQNGFITNLVYPAFE